MSESSVSPVVGLVTEGRFSCVSVLGIGGEGTGSDSLCSSWLTKKEFRVGVFVSGSTGTLE